jgi:hypothetical protein
MDAFTARNYPLVAIPMNLVRTRFVGVEDVVDAEFRDIPPLPALRADMPSSLGPALSGPLYAVPGAAASGERVEGAEALAALLRSAATSLTRPFKERVASWHAGQAQGAYQGYLDGIRGIEAAMQDGARGRESPEATAQRVTRLSKGVQRHTDSALRHGTKAGDHEWVKQFAESAKQQTETLAANASRVLPEAVSNPISDMAKKIAATVGDMFRAVRDGLRRRR